MIEAFYLDRSVLGRKSDDQIAVASRSSIFGRPSSHYGLPSRQQREKTRRRFVTSMVGVPDFGWIERESLHVHEPVLYRWLRLWAPIGSTIQLRRDNTLLWMTRRKAPLYPVFS